MRTLSRHGLEPITPRRCAWVALWLAVYVPSYWQAYGASHFLQLCNIGVLLTCLAWLTRSALWLSTQWLAAPLIAVLWLADVASTLLVGQPLHGGTLYLWDASIPWPARALSIYHVFLPLVLLHTLRITGYDHRALVVQSTLAIVVMAISGIIATPQNNLNYLYLWPDGSVPGGPTWLHGANQVILAVVMLYVPTHLLSLLMIKPANGHAESKPS
jgi:hypothetical protein